MTHQALVVTGSLSTSPVRRMVLLFRDAYLDLIAGAIARRAKSRSICRTAGLVKEGGMETDA
jgi:hypothetical protein